MPEGQEIVTLAQLRGAAAGCLRCRGMEQGTDYGLFPSVIEVSLNMTGLKKKELDKLKKLLEGEKQKILHHLQDLSKSSDQSMGQDSSGGDPVDIASLEIDQANLQKIGKRESYLLKKIDLALGKIAGGTYGECESCGEPIGMARLMARPVAQLCIDCKTDQENVERRFSTRDTGDKEDDGLSDETEES